MNRNVLINLKFTLSKRNLYLLFKENFEKINLLLLRRAQLMRDEEI